MILAFSQFNRVFCNLNGYVTVVRWLVLELRYWTVPKAVVAVDGKFSERRNHVKILLLVHPSWQLKRYVYTNVQPNFICWWSNQHFPCRSVNVQIFGFVLDINLYITSPTILCCVFIIQENTPTTKVVTVDLQIPRSLKNNEKEKKKNADGGYESVLTSYFFDNLASYSILSSKHNVYFN